jgi:LysR family transcriptional activator of nhaA
MISEPAHLQYRPLFFLHKIHSFHMINLFGAYMKTCRLVLMTTDWLNYRHLFYFWMIVKEGGYMRAAERLRLSQSSLSHQVKKLEEQFGQPLFSRESKRAFKLTDTGRKAYEYADGIFQMGRDLENWVRSGDSSREETIRIGAVGSLSKNFQILFLQELLAAPALTFQITVGEVGTLLQRLKDRELDLVISNVPAPPQADPFAISVELAQSGFVLAGKPTFSRLKKGFPKSLESQPIFSLLSPSASHLHFERILARAGVDVKFRGVVEDVALLRLIGLSGRGLIFLPKIGIVRDLEDKSLIELHSFTRVRESFYLIAKDTNHGSQAVSALIERAVKQLNNLKGL